MKKIKKINGVNTLMNNTEPTQCKLIAPTPIQRQTEENTGSVNLEFVHHNCTERCPFFKLQKSLNGEFDELTLLCVKDTLAPHYFFPTNKK